MQNLIYIEKFSTDIIFLLKDKLDAFGLPASGAQYFGLHRMMNHLSIL